MNYKKLPIVTQANSVTQIAQPLFDTSGLNFMNYYVIDNQGLGYGLATDGLYCEEFYKRKLKLSASVAQDGNFLWQSFQDSEAIEFSQQQYDYAHCLACVQKHDGYIETIVFAAPTANRQINNFYLNHYDILEKFMLYFKSKAADLINEAKASSVALPSEMHPKIKLNDYDTDNLEKFIKPKRVQVKGNNGPVYLTEKEMNVLKLYVRGISTKEIATRVFRSQKTVEYHISSAKKKLAVSRKQDLIDIHEAQPF